MYNSNAEMEQIRCPVCLDLSSDLFESSTSFLSVYGRLDDPARYRAIEFEDMRAASSARCHNCTILKQGTTLFRGTRPEEGDAASDDPERRLLVLQSCQEKSLIAHNLPAYRLYSWDPSDTTGIEFFSQDSK